MNLHFHVPSVSIKVERLDVHFPPGETAAKLDAILTNTETIMSQIDDAAVKLDGLTDQVGKIKTEVQALIDAVAAGGAGNTTPAFDAALARLTAAVQGVDEMNPDAPAVPAP